MGVVWVRSWQIYKIKLNFVDKAKLKISMCSVPGSMRGWFAPKQDAPEHFCGNPPRAVDPSQMNAVISAKRTGLFETYNEH